MTGDRDGERPRDANRKEDRNGDRDEDREEDRDVDRDGDREGDINRDKDTDPLNVKKGSIFKFEYFREIKTNFEINLSIHEKRQGQISHATVPLN